MTNEPKTETSKNTDPKTMTPDLRSPDVLQYSDLYKNAMMGADACAKMVGRTNAAEDAASAQAGTFSAQAETNAPQAVRECMELRQEITDMMTGYADRAKAAADALSDMGVPAEQLTMLEKLPAEIGITMKTMFDKSVSKCAELMVNGITMGIIDMKKAQRVCSEDGCSPAAYRMASDMIAFSERYVERMKEFL